MLVITHSLYEAIVAHARADHPHEACGVVAGPVGSDRPERFVPLPNAAPATVLHEAPSADLPALHRAMDDRGAEAVVLHHSHTASPARPSALGVEYTGEPRAHHVTVSTTEADAGGALSFRSFRIIDGLVTEEDVRINPGQGV
jgi:proteasome lid subunit RPN8/RPN11